MPKRLSRRERQVMRGIAGGQTSKEIAGLLDIAPSTVDWHVANALAKLQAANRTEGVVLALQRGELGRGPWAIGRSASWASGPWRLLFAAAFLALVIPTIVASDAGPATTAAPSASVPGSTAPVATAPAPTTITQPPPALPTVAPEISMPATATLAPLPSSPTREPLLTIAPITTFAPTLSVPPLPTVTLAPTVTLLPTVTLPPTITPLPSVPLPTIPLPTVQLPALPTPPPPPSPLLP